MADQDATPSAQSCAYNDETDLDEGMEDVEGPEGHIDDDQSTPGDSCQNEEGLQGYSSPQRTSPGHEIHEDWTPTYDDENDQHQFTPNYPLAITPSAASVATPMQCQAKADIDGDVERELRERELRESLKSLKDEQEFIDEQQKDVDRKRAVLRAVIFDYVYDTIGKVGSEVASCLDFVKGCEGQHFTVPKNLTTQGSPSRDCIPQHDLEMVLDDAHQRMKSIQALMQGIDQTPTPTRARFQAQSNALTVPLSACQNADGIGNGRTNSSGLTGDINSFTFETAFKNMGTTEAGAGNNGGDQFLGFHPQTANFGDGNMMSNTGQLGTPLGDWGQSATPFEARSTTTERQLGPIVSFLQDG